MNTLEEFTIGEIETMHDVIQGILVNCRGMQKGIPLQQSTIYNIDGNDKETMEKFISCLQQVIDTRRGR